MRKYFIISILIHLFIVLTMAPAANRENNKNNKQKLSQENLNVDIVSNNKKDDLLNIKKDPNGFYKKQHSPNNGCTKYFGGIGIEMDYFTSMITGVHPGYPADRAGIVKGDVIYTVNGDDIRGEIGTKIDLQINRNGKIFIVTLIREKICYK